MFDLKLLIESSCIIISLSVGPSGSGKQSKKEREGDRVAVEHAGLSSGCVSGFPYLRSQISTSGDLQWIGHWWREPT